MRISNSQAILFVNTVNQIKNKRLPVKIGFALRNNFKLIIANQLNAYEEELMEIKKCYSQDNDENSYREKTTLLLNEEVEHMIKTVKLEVFEMIDTEIGYDALSLTELDAISFMIEE